MQQFNKLFAATLETCSARDCIYARRLMALHYSPNILRRPCAGCLQNLNSQRRIGALARRQGEMWELRGSIKAI